MLRAARLAARRSSTCASCGCPRESTPRRWYRTRGRRRSSAAVADSVPFVRFRVERVLDGGDYGSPEGGERMLEELRPVFATVPPSAMRMELTRMVSERLELTESLAERDSMTSRERLERWRGRLPVGTSARECRPHRGLAGRSTERAFLRSASRAGARRAALESSTWSSTSPAICCAVRPASARRISSRSGAGLPEDDRGAVCPDRRARRGGRPRVGPPRDARSAAPAAGAGSHRSRDSACAGTGTRRRERAGSAPRARSSASSTTPTERALEETG